jgi:hypothetical protein
VLLCCWCQMGALGALAYPAEKQVDVVLTGMLDGIGSVVCRRMGRSCSSRLSACSRRCSAKASGQCCCAASCAMLTNTACHPTSRYAKSGACAMVKGTRQA